MKNFKILPIIGCLLAAAVGLSGCSEATLRLDEQDIIQGAAIDEKDGGIRVTLQSFDLIKEGTGSDSLTGNLTYNIAGSGKDISSALSDASKKTAHELFLGQNKLLVFSRGLVENGFEESLDYLLRGINARADVLVGMADGEAAEIMECTQNDALVPAQDIAQAITAAAKEGWCPEVNIKDLMNAYANAADAVLLPVLTAGGSEEKKRCEVSGTALYRDGALQAVLGSSESRGLMLLRQKLQSGNFSFSTGDYGRISLELVRSSPRQTVRWENGKVHVRFKVTCTFTVSEVEKGLVTDISQKEIAAIQTLANEQIETMCLLACRLTYGHGCDVFGTGRRLSRTDAAAYRENAAHWPETIQQAEYSVQADCRIRMLNNNAVRD